MILCLYILSNEIIQNLKINLKTSTRLSPIDKVIHQESFGV